MQVKQYLKPFLFGLFGVIVALAGLHLYQDHKNIHDLVNWANQVEANAKKAQEKPNAEK